MPYCSYGIWLKRVTSNWVKYAQKSFWCYFSHGLNQKFKTRTEINQKQKEMKHDLEKRNKPITEVKVNYNATK